MNLILEKDNTTAKNHFFVFNSLCQAIFLGKMTVQLFQKIFFHAHLRF